MNAYFYRVPKKRCIPKCKMELAAFLGGINDAYADMGGQMDSYPFADGI